MQPFETLPDLLEYALRRNENAAALHRHVSGSWVPVTTAELGRRVRHLTLGLYELGVKPGEPVGLIAPSSPSWLLVDLAIMSLGAVTVPLFTRISPESMAHEIKDSGMRSIFVGSVGELPMVRKTGGRRLQNVVTFGLPEGGDDLFEQLLQDGAKLDEKRPALFHELRRAVEPHALATISYTSGSSGLPKGVELTHRNIVSQIRGAARLYPLAPSENRALCALPLAHIFERMVSYFYLANGVPLYFAHNPKRLPELIRELQPTVMTAVPRMLEKACLQLHAEIDGWVGVAGRIARRARARAETKPPNEPPRLTDRLYGALVYRKLLDTLGGRFRIVISGAATLQADIARFLWNIGLPVYEGYGLTEASPVIAANYPAANKIGTVGLPFPEVEVKITADREILARGPSIMRGYHNNKQATAQTIDSDGWLHTGDLGHLDAEGYLTIEGRRKEIFKKSTGEYVPPVPIEQRLARHPVVDKAVVIADGRVSVTVLLFPDPDGVTEHKRTLKMPHMSDEEFLQSEVLSVDLSEFIHDVNDQLHHCESIENFRLLPRPLSIDSGELTPTMKVHRQAIEAKYRDLIEEMYAEQEAWEMEIQEFEL